MNNDKQKEKKKLYRNAIIIYTQCYIIPPLALAVYGWVFMTSPIRPWIILASLILAFVSVFIVVRNVREAIADFDSKEKQAEK